MPVTPFRPVSWNPGEDVSEDKMDRMANNEQWLFENMPRMNYRAHGVRRSEGVKFCAGLARIGASKKPHGVERVDFGNFFSAMSRPVVVGTVISRRQRRFFLTIEGTGQLHPDNKGFRAHVIVDASNKKNRKIERTIYVAWQAMGY